MPRTKLVVLGMLDMKPMSGYDIQTTLQVMDAERWSGILVGSIYHALKKLEIEHYIEIDRIEYSGNRQKSIYKITQLGKEHLNELTIQALKKSSIQYPASLYAALTFNSNLPRESICDALTEQLKLINKELEYLQRDLAAKKAAYGGEIDAITTLAMNNMFSIANNQKQFVEGLIKLL